MHQLLVLYPHPDDPTAFLDYYRATHLPLAAKLPGLISMEFGQPKSLGRDASPYFAVFRGLFESEDALFCALGSPAGKAVAEDVANYSPKGATILHMQVAAQAI